MAEYPPALVAQAVEAARRALKDLDDDEVPVPLRKAAASSARRLPPPIAERVAKELDTSSWLRERALAAWPDADPDGEDPVEAGSALFLSRPEGWEERLEAMAARLGEESRRRAEGAERRRVTRMEEEIAALQRRLDEARGEADRLVSSAVAREAARGERAARRVAELEAEVARMRREGDAAGAEIADLGKELEEADARIESLRRSIGRERERLPSVTGEAGSWTWSRGRPVELARSLDQLLETVLAPPEGGLGGPGEARPAGLPDGVRPDRPEAVDWLLRLQAPVSLVVDGYNVVHQLTGTPEPARRELLERSLARIRRLADAPVRVTVVYDSAAEASTHHREGLEIRFVPDADDEVRAAASRASGIVVVVSSDRAVREGVAARPVIGLWSEALAGWITRRR